MKDRIPGSPGRVKITPEGGASYYAVLERADNPLEEGTPLNKANLLSDQTAYKLGLSDAEATPNMAFAKISEGGLTKVGDIKETLRSSLGNDWALCNGAEYTPEEYPELAAQAKYNLSTWEDSDYTAASGTPAKNTMRGAVYDGQRAIFVYYSTPSWDYVDTGSIGILSGNTLTKVALSSNDRACAIACGAGYYAWCGWYYSSSSDYSYGQIWYTTNIDSPRNASSVTLKIKDTRNEAATGIAYADNKFAVVIASNHYSDSGKIYLASSSALGTWTAAGAAIYKGLVSANGYFFNVGDYIYTSSNENQLIYINASTGAYNTVTLSYSGGNVTPYGILYEAGYYYGMFQTKNSSFVAARSSNLTTWEFSSHEIPVFHNRSSGETAPYPFTFLYSNGCFLVYTNNGQYAYTYNFMGTWTTYETGTSELCSGYATNSEFDILFTQRMRRKLLYQLPCNTSSDTYSFIRVS